MFRIANAYAIAIAKAKKTPPLPLPGTKEIGVDVGDGGVGCRRVWMHACLCQ